VLYQALFADDLEKVGQPVWSVIPALFLRGDRRLSQLPWRPRYRFAMLSDPGRTSTPDPCGASVLPPLSSQRRLPLSIKFRGSITRLHGSLPTLEDAISGRQPRLASGGWSILSGRVDSRRVSPVAFSCSFSVSPFGLLLLTCERLLRLSGLWLAPDEC